MNLWTYSPESVKFILAGFHTVEGLVSGNFIKITKMIQPSETARTADNTITRVIKTSNLYKVEVQIYNCSPSNEILTKFWQADELARGTIKFPILIKDTSGSGFFFAPTCWIENIPELMYSDNVDQNLWTFMCHEGIINYGSSQDPSTAGKLLNIASSGIPLLAEYLTND